MSYLFIRNFMLIISKPKVKDLYLLIFNKKIGILKKFEYSKPKESLKLQNLFFVQMKYFVSIILTTR